MEEVILLERCRSHEEGAFEELLENYGGMIRRIVGHYPVQIGDYTIPKEDLFQEASLALYDAVKQYVPDKGMKFSSFAYLVMRRRIQHKYSGYIAVYKREAASLDNEFRGFDSISAFFEDPLERHEMDEKKRVLYRFIRTLTEEDRKILELRSRAYAYKEIAEELSVPVKRVDNKIARMKKMYRRYQSGLTKTPEHSTI